MVIKCYLEQQVNNFPAGTAPSIKKLDFAICITLKSSLERISNLQGLFLLVLYILIENLK